MSWVALEDDFITHPKVMGLTDAEFRAWIRLLCWCAKHRTKGRLTKHVGSEVVGVTSARLRKFSELGLLDEDEDGQSIHDWDEYNGTGRERELARQRKRDQRERDRAGHSPNAGRDIVTEPNGTKSQVAPGDLSRSLARARDARASQSQPQPHTHPQAFTEALAKPAPEPELHNADRNPPGFAHQPAGAEPGTGNVASDTGKTLPPLKTIVRSVQ